MDQPAQNLHTTEHTWHTQVVLQKTIQLASPPLPTSGTKWDEICCGSNFEQNLSSDNLL